MADKMDDILQHVADQANAQVDYEAMHASILKKARAGKLAARKKIVRYGSVAAAVLIVTVGLTVFGRSLRMGSAASEANDENECAFYAAENPQADTSTADESTEERDMLGSALVPKAEGEDACSGSGGGGDGDSINDAVTPPGCSTANCDTLYWEEKGLELPAVDFGESSEVESDSEHFLCTVTNATADDYEAYIALVNEMYPDGADNRGEATNTSEEYDIVVRLADDQYAVSISLSAGVLTISAQLSDN